VSGLVLVPWICAGLALGEALLARALLAPTRRSRLRARVAELTTTRAAAADVQADELRRIERDLHDGAQARLVAVAMELGRARDKLDTDPAAARALVDAAHEETKTALVELRELVSGMYPAILTDRGLDAALSSIAARCPVPVTLDVELGDRLPSAVEVAAYFVVAESLTNVAKHSEATSGSVRIRRSQSALAIDVLDDGVGGADPSAGSGLAGLRDRVAALDGTLSLSSPFGGPTTLRVEIPCAS
jgi:signal transduction histidine kinase